MNLIPISISQLIQNRDWNGLLQLFISKLPTIAAALLIIVVGFIISNLIGKLLIKAMRLKGVDASIHNFIRTIVTIILKLAVILSALSTIGVDVNSFIAALAAGGLTAGLGLQQSVAQFASGIQILVNHPFRSGDYIDIGSVSGTVREIKIMHTVLITPDNKRVIVPNSTVTNSNIINFNSEKKRRLDLVFPISYSQDIEKARQAILKVANAGELILQDPQATVNVKEHSAIRVNLICLAWCETDNYWDAFFYMQEGVKNEFDKQGIEIPMNQLVYIDGVNK